MGNYRFKLSDMMPNAWFYKLRDNMGGGTTRNQTSSTRKKKQSSSQNSTTTTTTTTQSSKPKCNPRKSYYFTRELSHTSLANNNLNISETNFPQQPRKSSKQKPKKKTQKTSFSSSSPVYSSEEESEFPDPEIRTDRVLLQAVKFDEKISTCSGCNKLHNDNNDIIINVDNNSLAKKDDVFDSFPKLMMLPPIVTKPEKFNDLLNDAKKKEIKKRSLKVKIVKQEQRNNNNNNISGRRFSVNSPGVKLRINSPRIGSRKVQLQQHGRRSVTGTGTGGYRKSLSDSLAIVKSSVNPQRDFRESMVEMIVQNNIRSSKDLEDLLACYLSLNSDEYHEIIIKVFKQIWFDLTDNQ